MADQDPHGETHHDILSLCVRIVLREKVMMTHVGAVITCKWVLLLVAIILDTKERVSYATVTHVASV